MRFPLVAALTLLTASAHGADVEVTVLGGRVVPFYEQAFTYDPGQLASPVPQTTIDQQGVFRLEASGGLALSVAVATHVAGPLAIEARLDTADVSVPTEGARYRVRSDRPPFPGVTTDIDLGSGEVDLQRLRPVSLNLRLAHRGGRFRGGVSAGPSYLPAFRFELDQRLGVDVPLLGQLDVVRLRLPAEAAPTGEGQSRIGGNVGAFAGWRVAPRVDVVVDMRWFYFREQTLQWGELGASLPLPTAYLAVVDQIVRGLDPVEFNPTFFHFALGVSYRF